MANRNTLVNLICGISLLTMMMCCNSLGDTIDNEPPALNDNLQILEPMVNKKWVGEMKALDRDGYLETVRQFEVIWSGEAIRILTYCNELGSFREGFIYWDANENKIALFSLNNRGIIQNGTVTKEDGKIVFTGNIKFPDRELEYRNIFEIGADGRLFDKWFRFENGEWKAGHDVVLTAEE